MAKYQSRLLQQSKGFMKKEFLYRYKNQKYPAIAEERSFFEGKSVGVEIYNKDGTVKSLIKFVCHLEFEDYEYYQNKNISELIDIAIQRINSGAYDSVLNEESEHKLERLYRFNQTGKIER